MEAVATDEKIHFIVEFSNVSFKIIWELGGGGGERKKKKKFLAAIKGLRFNLIPPVTLCY